MFVEKGRNKEEGWGPNECLFLVVVVVVAGGGAAGAGGGGVRRYIKKRGGLRKCNFPFTGGGGLGKKEKSMLGRCKKCKVQHAYANILIQVPTHGM